jgi:L-threonylcarbamoyladenylate synthase
VGVPLAAPSANVSEHVSPTTAAHVLADLDGRIDGVLDGGPCPVGIESTVLSLAHGPPRILRPGAISREALEAELGPIAAGPLPGGVVSSPGQHARHYAPAGRLVLAARGALEAALARLPAPRGAVVRGVPFAGADACEVLPDEPAGYARGLYAALRSLEERGCASVAVESPPEHASWEAVRDRLARAAG